MLLKSWLAVPRGTVPRCLPQNRPGHDFPVVQPPFAHSCSFENPQDISLWEKTLDEIPVGGLFAEARGPGEVGFEVQCDVRDSSHVAPGPFGAREDSLERMSSRKSNLKPR